MTLAERLMATIPPKGEATWDEEAKVAAAAPALQLRAILGELRQQGWRPSLAYTWRGLRTQAALRAAGNTKVNFSLHNVVDADGRPAALAADVFDARYGWGKPEQAAEFFEALGAAARSRGLEWGGSWSRSDPHWAPFDLGWDPGHIQAPGYRDLQPQQKRCLPLLLGDPRLLVQDGYGFKVWSRPEGTYIEVAVSPTSHRRPFYLPGASAKENQTIATNLGRLANATEVQA